MRHVVLTVPVGDAEAAADRLWAAGATAVEERDRGGAVELRCVLAQVDEVSADRLGWLRPRWRLTFDDVADEPSETWREFAQPVRVNDELVIRPSWTAPPDGGDAVDVSIEPGGAFGLGDHPTTRLAADATWRFTGAGDRVLDVGCGSGVLGIVAARRGASHVTAIDIADAAREATVANAALNGVGDRLAASTEPVGSVEGRYDLVLANILAPVLVAMAPDLRRLTRAGGHLVVAGVLADRWSHVAAALAPLTVVETHRVGEWESIVFRAAPA